METRSPRLARMLTDGERERTIAEAALKSLTAEELLSGVIRSPELTPLVIAWKPELIISAAFWSARSIKSDAAFAMLSNRPDLASLAVAAMIESGRDDLAAKAIAALGAPTVMRDLAAGWQTRDPGISGRWLKTLCAHSAALAEFFSTAPSIPGELLVNVARCTSPDALPNEYGDDPWLEALSSSPISSAGIDTYLACYLLARALGWRSQNPAGLVQFGFDAAYNAMADDRLPEDAWRLLEDRLPWVNPFVSWDRCVRVGKAIAALFVDRNLPAAVFARISENDSNFADLARAAARIYRGRDYLNRVRLAELSGKYVSRKRIIADLVEGW